MNPPSIPLHVVGASPFQGSALADCLAAAFEPAPVLLIGEAVRALAAPPPELADLAGSGRLFVLSEDAAARGLDPARLAGTRPMDYAGFVELAARHAPVVSWY